MYNSNHYILNIGVNIMEIKYKNTIEDVEIFCNYFSEKFLKGSLYIERNFFSLQYLFLVEYIIQM